MTPQAPFTIDDLTAIAISIIGNRRISLREDMTAADVPGWDSLAHTLITMEVSSRRGHEFKSRAFAEAADFGQVVAMVNAADAS